MILAWDPAQVFVVNKPVIKSNDVGESGMR